MKSLVSLWSVLATELAQICGTDAKRDISSLSRRVEHEGDAFLRITLPSYGKSFDEALEHGRLSSDLFPSFKKKSGGFPVFLQGFLRLVFDTSGNLASNPSVDAIYSIRQLCSVFGKIESRCSPRREWQAVQDYCAADDHCAQWDIDVSSSLLDEMIDVSSRVLSPFLSRADFLVKEDRIQPKHGPGKTADRLVGNRKFDLQYWPDHLESRYSWSDWAVPNYRYISCDGEDGRSTHCLPAKLSLVPKTMSTPRVIVMEPTSLQYMQQGILGVLVESIESVTTLIGFSDQGVNRSMARQASQDRSLATIDLSEASDRVTYLQAASCFSSFPNLWEALDATRSSEVSLPNGVRPVKKFASMGSAVCFPVEAVVFLTAIFVAIQRHHRKADPGFCLNWSFIRKFEGSVRVYGDDLVIPVKYLLEVQELFSELGWKINSRKSFWRSYLRESCGGEYWDGVDITPVKARAFFPSTLKQTAETQSLVSFRNQLYMAGLWKTASSLDELILQLFRGTFPIVEETSPALGRISVSFPPLWRGTDRYQRALTKAYTVRTVIPKNTCSERGALLKCLISPGKDDEHLQRSGRPSDVSIIRRWMPVS